MLCCVADIGLEATAGDTQERLLASFLVTGSDSAVACRGYLAKGVLLRQEGRKGDADRAFLQARFMAPKELRAIVDRVAAPENPSY